MMENLTRRKLITQASAGAGAAGMLAITAACNTSGPTTTTTIPDATGIPTPTTDEPLAVFVTDLGKGTLIVMKGEKEVVVNNPSLAQSLLGLA